MPRLVVLGDGEGLPLDALANQSAADALGADASGPRAPFRLLDVNSLQVEVEVPFGDSGRFAAVATQVFGLPAFDLGVASAGNAFANFTRSTHDSPTFSNENRPTDPIWEAGVYWPASDLQDRERPCARRRMV